MSKRSTHLIMRRRARDGLMCTQAFLADTVYISRSLVIEHMRNIKQ